MAHHNLDSLDKKILKLIAEDARMPFLEVARVCNVSGAAIHQRIQKLNNQGVLKGSKFNIDPEKIGYETCAFIGINLKHPENFDEVVEKLKRIPEIVECHYTTGNYTMNVFVVRDAGIATGTTLDAIFVDVNNKMENVTYGASVNTSADVLTPAAGSTTYTLTRDGSANVKEDATITLKVTSGVAAVPAGGQVVTVKCNETGETKTVTFDANAAAGTVKTITFAQKAYATTYSLVKGAVADTLA